MRSRSALVLASGFGAVVVLIAVLGISAIVRARAIYRQLEQTQDTYLANEAFRRDITADMYLADILVRDYLLDPSRENAPLHRRELLAIRASLQSRIEYLAQNLGETDIPGLPRLQEQVQAYWDSLDPIFEWTPQQKSELAWSFLRKSVFPRRAAVVELAREVARANHANLEKERQRIGESQRVFRSFLIKMLVLVVPFAMVVAAVTIRRVTLLEHRADQQRQRIQNTEQDLRRLSRRLVQAQEAERKSLSRELHDEVGQTLTAVGIELGNAQALARGSAESIREKIDEARRLNGSAIRTIRDMAMGLRPSMLDDLGLAPALQWQGREFSRLTGVPANIDIDDLPESLSEAHRTCIYRVVQEALTNCAKHSSPTKVDVNISVKNAAIELVISDDGRGMDPNASTGSGLGLIGMRERVEELNGTLTLISMPKHGATLRATIPMAIEEQAWAKPAS